MEQSELCKDDNCGRCPRPGVSRALRLNRNRRATYGGAGCGSGSGFGFGFDDVVLWFSRECFFGVTDGLPWFVRNRTFIEARLRVPRK